MIFPRVWNWDFIHTKRIHSQRAILKQFAEPAVPDITYATVEGWGFLLLIFVDVCFPLSIASVWLCASPESLGVFSHPFLPFHLSSLPLTPGFPCLLSPSRFSHSPGSSSVCVLLAASASPSYTLKLSIQSFRCFPSHTQRLTCTCLCCYSVSPLLCILLPSFPPPPCSFPFFLSVPGAATAAIFLPSHPLSVRINVRSGALWFWGLHPCWKRQAYPR